MRSDRSMRAAMNIRYSDDVLNVMEEVGMSVTSVDRKRYPDARLGELTAYAIKDLGSVPDAISDPGTNKKGPMIRILGKDPADLKRKIEQII
jgi:hydroxymethylpyrimidine/phosphomethylpyrimidine kinase